MSPQIVTQNGFRSDPRADLIVVTALRELCEELERINVGAHAQTARQCNSLILATVGPSTTGSSLADVFTWIVEKWSRGELSLHDLGKLHRWCKGLMP